MDTIVGIDLGTTNSVVAIVEEGRIRVIEENGEALLPSVVGLDERGEFLVGVPARNQYVLAPDRTVRSVKRKMGEASTVRLGGQDYTPQEISAIILRRLKQRAEKSLGRRVEKAVITVPAFFTEIQREATREAGELAGLEVVRIINEPTAAALTYEPHPTDLERLLVYDLGGGTFDVSVVQIEQGVVEVLASHGDTHLGGDDFDQLLLDDVCQSFADEHGIDLRESPRAKSRLLQAVEAAKIRLSDEAVVPIEEEFIAEKDGVPLHLNVEIHRYEYEELIEPLLLKTLRCLDEALDDARLQVVEIDKVVLVGGASRTPMVHRLLEERLRQPIHSELHPDLCVAMGAAVQGALIAGTDVGPVLVDITPHTLGIQAIGELGGFMSHRHFAPIIERNTPLPASRSELFATAHDQQRQVLISIFQGEDPDVQYNKHVGEFMLEGLAEVEAGNEILVRFTLDLNGILTVAATERATGLEKQLRIDNAMDRFRRRDRLDAQHRLESAFQTSELLRDAGRHETPAESPHPGADQPLSLELKDAINTAIDLIVKGEKLLDTATPEDAEELREKIAELRSAVAARSEGDIQDASAELEDLVFYLEDAV